MSSHPRNPLTRRSHRRKADIERRALSLLHPQLWLTHIRILSTNRASPAQIMSSRNACHGETTSHLIWLTLIFTLAAPRVLAQICHYTGIANRNPIRFCLDRYLGQPRCPFYCMVLVPPLRLVTAAKQRRGATIEMSQRSSGWLMTGKLTGTKLLTQHRNCVHALFVLLFWLRTYLVMVRSEPAGGWR